MAGAPDKIRCLAWHKQDSLLLTSYIDQPGIGCATGFEAPSPQLPSTISVLLVCAHAGIPAWR